MTRNKMAPKKTIANPDLPNPPSGKYPAKAHARRVAKWVSEHGGPSSGIIYLEGQSEKIVEDDDTTAHFRQRRHFYYLTGCDEPDCFFAYDIKTDKSTLWIPPVDPEQVMWAGLPLLPKEAMERYDVDEVLTSDHLKSGESLVSMLEREDIDILAIKDRFDPSIFQNPSISTKQPKLNYDWTRKAIETCRIIKDSFEISLIRHANIISSYAHERILTSSSHARNERELNALFVMHCHANGCKEQAYGCICAAGAAGSTLHYVHNDMPLQGKQNILLDAGAEYSCYCADITRTFPITPDGKFTPESRDIYLLVLKMQSECMKLIRGDMIWEEVHMKAHTVAAAGLQNLGILRSSLSIDQILSSHITTRFFPHGLGHYLGMDTHDTGGNANYSDPNPFFTYLRVRGRVPAGAVITNEPGIYFREYPLEKELEEGKWEGVVDREVLKRYWDVGGVRIEDDILVKEGGYENLTTVGSGLDEVEAMVKAGMT